MMEKRVIVDRLRCGLIGKGSWDLQRGSLELIVEEMAREMGGR